MKHVHILVHGRVQNLDDGSVEIIAEGGETLLRQLTEILKTRHPLAKIKGIDASWGDAKKEFEDFEIRR